ncbi:unnamed protein product [Caenorhabditis angaria]|uniref:G-patch domain-containing protein n=1 Tax=Caenorhabditis angaria TaxID=860376 RepID=A0A9P1MX46_9PELO|nr:unnamed protein product [Caenorhabditis angaria]
MADLFGEGSIADILRQTANEVIHANAPEGFEWIEEYQQYYSKETRYYFDPNTMLYYNGDTMTYYRFNEETYSYEIVECCQPTKWSSSGYRKRAIQAIGEGEFKKFTQENVDICETLFNVIGKVLKAEHVENPVQKEVAVVKIPTAEEIRKILMRKRKWKNIEQEEEVFDEHSGNFQATTSYQKASEDSEEESESEVEINTDERIGMMKEEGFDEAPGLRIIDKNGQLFIITKSGGYIGSDSESEVVLTNRLLPERCAEINYSEDIGCYSIVKLEESCVVSCNSNVLKIDSPVDICHGDVVQISGEKFEIHVHFGSNTCPGCEPGLFQNPEAQEAQGQAKNICGELARRKTLKKLMNSYGITPNSELSGPIRRKKPEGPSLMNIERDQGSRDFGTYGNCAAKPIAENLRKFEMPTSSRNSEPPKLEPKPISAENVGFKLLKSMGWKEGKGLGKDKQGNIEPISTEIKNNRQGLGSSSQKSSQPKSQKEMMLEKMKERFNKI